MKTLYIIRHAKSSWDDPNLTDFDRPLNNRGKSDAKMMAEIFANQVKSVGAFVSSTAKRAVKTTNQFIERDDLSYNTIEYTDLLYHASAQKIADVIAGQENQNDSIAIVGHNPGLTDFANEFGNVTIDNLPTTGILAFAFDIEKWENVLSGDGKLLFFEYPKRYKA